MTDVVIFEELEVGLSKLRNALRSASFSEIPDIAREFEATHRKLQKFENPTVDLSAIANEITAALKLIAAASRGLQSARNRIEQYGKPKTAFVTYKASTIRHGKEPKS
ncbi:hypothetical protein [Tropicimonas sp. S265A]|uniref:hypothetical protein n=1 Tax=Tropicimonas sp. S265A TaxID=3415134 RepID=UPI003C7E6545